MSLIKSEIPDMVKIIRTEKTVDGVFGDLFIDNDYFCKTLEPEDKSNMTGISCIPEGTYICKRYHSEKYPNTFEVTNVKDRSYILIHPGNTEDDSRGCILIGETLGKLKGKRAILNSGKTFKNFMMRFENVDQFKLIITTLTI